MAANFINNPILITGAARSGTSVTAGVVHICGAWGGLMADPNDYNLKGYYENLELGELIKSFLKQCAVDPLGQWPLPHTQHIVDEISEEAVLAQIDTRIRTILLDQGYSPTGPWMLKQAKLLLIWPVFAALFPAAKWVLVRRDSEKICDSCLHAPFMSRFKDRNGWKMWLDIHLQKLSEIQSSVKNVFEFWPDRAMGDDLDELRSLIQFCGLPFKKNHVKKFIDPGLWHAGNPWASTIRGQA
jgi:hypothetical protein